MTKNRLTCGDFGGLNAQGEPCGVASVNGPCARHADQVNAVATTMLNPGFDFMTPPFVKTKNKVCIVGFTDHRALALDLNRDEWEIWGLNELYRYMPIASFDRWFEIHGREYLEKDEDGQRHIEDLKSLSVPIYMQKVHEDIPASVRFPIEELCEQLGSKYWTNCPAYMLGMAIAMGFEEIMMCGVDMAQDCVAPDTKVLTADLRWVNAEDVEVGDELLAFDEEPGSGTSAVAQWRHEKEENGGVAVAKRPRAARMWRKSKVLGKSRKLRDSYRVHFEDGSSIVASAGHGWLTYGEHQMKWKRTDELVTPQHRHPTKVVRVLDTWNHDRTWESGYLAAAFDGEGWISQSEHRAGGTKSLSVGFSQRDNAMADRVRTELALKGFEWGEHPNGDCINFQIKGGRPEILRFLGQVRPERLLENLSVEDIGVLQRKETLAVVDIEHLGEVDTVGFTTSTHTLITEGILSHNTEYFTQRPCCEYWIGRAQGAGIKCWVPEESDLMKCIGLYGYPDEGSLLSRKLEKRLKWLHEQDNQRLGALRGMQAEYDNKSAEVARRLSMCHGAREEAARAPEGPERDARVAKIDEEIGEWEKRRSMLDSEFNSKHQKLRDERNQIIGGIQDVNYIMRSWLVRADSDQGGLVPDRSKDPRTGIQPPAGDSAGAVPIERIFAGAL